MKQEKNLDDEFYKSEKAKATAEKNREENKRRKEEKAAKQREKAGKPPKSEKQREKAPKAKNQKKYHAPPQMQISPMRQEMLKRLALNSDASLQEIKKAYHTLALQYHPDKFNGRDDKFKEILQAYEFLTK